MMGGDIGRYAAVTRSHSLHNLHTTPHKYWGVELEVGELEIHIEEENFDALMVSKSHY